MNIFYTDECPKIAAQNMVDKHVVKMILEYLFIAIFDISRNIK